MKILKIPVLRPGGSKLATEDTESTEKTLKAKFQVPPCRFYKKLSPLLLCGRKRP
jgi:hypothetical protein